MTTDTSGRPAGRLKSVLLVVSLAFNVLFLGGIATAFILGHHHGPHGPKGGGLMGFARTLPKERREAVRTKLKEEQKTLAPLRKAEQEARQAARAVLLEEPFDKDKFKAALDKAVAAETDQKRARMSVFAEMTGGLTAEERKQLYDWIERRRPNPPPPPGPEGIDEGKPE
jgi:uncharacterized membrane protein